MSVELIGSDPARTSGTLMSLDNVRFGYGGGAAVIAEATFDIGRGQMLGLVGPSGSGKTTLLQLIGGLLTPDVGRLEGRPPFGSIRWIFQVPAALGRRSVIDNTRIGLHELGLGEDVAHERVERALDAVGLRSLGNRKAKSLSGGELQRLQIARALISEPILVLADEPTGQLDHQSTLAVADALNAARQGPSTVVLATHDPDLVAACDRRLEVVDGKVREMGS